MNTYLNFLLSSSNALSLKKFHEWQLIYINCNLFDVTLKCSLGLSKPITQRFILSLNLLRKVSKPFLFSKYLSSHYEVFKFLCMILNQLPHFHLIEEVKHILLMKEKWILKQDQLYISFVEELCLTFPIIHFTLCTLGC